MSTNSINDALAKLQSLQGKLNQLEGQSTEKGSGFDKLLEETIGQVTSLQKDAEKAIKELTSGDGDVVQAMISMQKAEVSFRTMVEVRNKLVSAYEEIMRMQV